MALTRNRNRMISGASAMVTDYGAATAAVDNTAAFQRAIDTGLDVVVPPGNWSLIGPITLTTSGQYLTGAGADCRILSTSLTADIIRIGNGTDEVRGVVVKDINVYASVIKTAGVAIRLRVAEQCAIVNCGISSAQDYAATGTKLYDGITFEEAADCTIDACSLWGFGRDAIRIYGGAVHNAEISITGGTWITYAERYGVYLGGRFGGLRLLDGDISACWRDLNIDQLLTPTYPNREIFIGSSFSIDASSDANIWVGSGGASTIEATGLWCASAGRTTGVGPSETNKTGIQIDPGNTNLTMRITGGKIFNCSGAGMTINEGQIFLNDVIVSDNGTGTGLSDHGIWLVAAAGNEGPIQITNCYFVGNAGYDVMIAGQLIYSRITDNTFRGGGTGTINTAASTPSSDNILARNIGYPTKTEGTGVILSGQTQVVFNHGLVATPNSVQVTALNTVPEGRGLSVLAATSTQLTVGISSAAAADRDFYWTASYGVQI
jgi:hypothetical protein